jgi:hypothetical protein
MNVLRHVDVVGIWCCSWRVGVWAVGTDRVLTHAKQFLGPTSLLD